MYPPPLEIIGLYPCAENVNHCMTFRSDNRLGSQVYSTWYGPQAGCLSHTLIINYPTDHTVQYAVRSPGRLSVTHINSPLDRTVQYALRSPGRLSVTHINYPPDRTVQYAVRSLGRLSVTQKLSPGPYSTKRATVTRPPDSHTH
jgi:hypothetical protein